MSFMVELKTSKSGGSFMVELNTSYSGGFVGCGDHASADSAANGGHRSQFDLKTSTP